MDEPDCEFFTYFYDKVSHRLYIIILVTQLIPIMTSWSNNDEVKKTSTEIDIKAAHFLDSKMLKETKE